MNRSKKCIDCLYYVADKGIKEKSECLKFGKLKEQAFQYAEKCRTDPKKCGEEAKYFISKYLK